MREVEEEDRVKERKESQRERGRREDCAEGA